MAKKQTDNTIHDAEFTETPAGESEEVENDEATETNNSLVIASPLKPLNLGQAESDSFSISVKSLLITVAVIAVLLLAALYLRGLQLAAV